MQDAYHQPYGLPMTPFAEPGDPDSRTAVEGAPAKQDLIPEPKWVVL